jgi:hypothetical protein
MNKIRGSETAGMCNELRSKSISAGVYMQKQRFESVAPCQRPWRMRFAAGVTRPGRRVTAPAAGKNGPRPASGAIPHGGAQPCCRPDCQAALHVSPDARPRRGCRLLAYRMNDVEHVEKDFSFWIQTLND